MVYRRGRLNHHPYRAVVGNYKGWIPQFFTTFRKAYPLMTSQNSLEGWWRTILVKRCHKSMTYPFPLDTSTTENWRRLHLLSIRLFFFHNITIILKWVWPGKFLLSTICLANPIHPSKKSNNSWVISNAKAF